MTTTDTFRPTWKGVANVPSSIPEGCFAVTTYRVEEVCGGPEEGGWWYTWYTALAVTLCPTQQDATTLMEQQRADDEAATREAKQTEEEYNASCLRLAERTGAEPDSIGSLDFGERYITVVEAPDKYLGLLQTERPHYE
jgi:hypothetical protein